VTPFVIINKRPNGLVKTRKKKKIFVKKCNSPKPLVFDCSLSVWLTAFSFSISRQRCLYFSPATAVAVGAAAVAAT
jgi:hypothetical protein